MRNTGYHCAATLLLGSILFAAGCSSEKNAAQSKESASSAASGESATDGPRADYGSGGSHEPPKSNAAQALDRIRPQLPIDAPGKSGGPAPRIPIVNGPSMPVTIDPRPTDDVSLKTTEHVEDQVAVETSKRPRSSAQKESTKAGTSSVDTLSARPVEVFFATDRLPTDQVIPSFGRVFLPLLAVGSLCCAMFIGLSVTRRFQVFWMLGNGLAVCLTLMVLHVCILRWQQYSRLASNAGTRFSTFRDATRDQDYPLHVGNAIVTVPPTHEAGEIESPSLLRLEFKEDPEKHILLYSLQVQDSVDQWFDDISSQAQQSKGEGFIFIHGYNVRFSAALKRTAQLAVDLEVDGPVISYSWPSRGNLAGYTADEATVAWSAPHFEKLLLDLRERTECRAFNIVAHSMGNRALLNAVDRIHLREGQRAPGTSKVIGSLVLAAPDIDAQRFNAQYVESISQVADKTTIYFSTEDLALKLSHTVHRAPRLGSDPRQLPRDPDIEVVHIGDHGLFSLGHAYYGSDRVVLDDIRRLFHHDAPANSREYLRSVRVDGQHAYWELDRQLHAQMSQPTVR